MEPSSFWKNPEGVELACYEWLPDSEIKFVVYLVHGSVHGCVHGNIHDMKKHNRINKWVKWCCI